MAYEVTASRKRPQTFDEMAGQEFVVSTLKASIEQGRIAHAYLFSGPRGVGKTSAARILARSLNCEQGPTTSPCGTCAACREIARGNSLDVIEIDGASNTSVNDVREIKDEVLFAPNSSRYKVYIIDEVHMLSNSAFNALLKTIEEPPPYIVFVFATTEIHKVPATIRSRCQQFTFRLFALETIKKLLAAVCEEMKIEAEEEALFWIAKEATGSMRDAYTLFDQVVSFAGGKITMELIREKLGLAGFDALGAVVAAMASEDAQTVLTLSAETLERGVSIEQYINDLSDYFRSLLFIKHGIHKESLLGYTFDRFASEPLEAFSVTQLEQAVALLLELYRNIRFSPNQRFELDLVLSRLSSLGSYLTPGEILGRIQAIRSDVSGRRAEAGATASSDTPRSGGARSARAASEDERRKSRPPARSAEAGGAGGTAAPGESPAQPDATGREGAAEGGEAASDSLGLEGDEEPYDEGDSYGEEADWETVGGEERADEPETPGSLLRREVVAGLRKSKLNLSSALEKAVSWNLEGDTLTITFDNGFSATLVREEVAVVSAKVQEVAGRTVKIVVETENGNDAPRPARTDEKVELVKRIFRGEVIQGGES